MGTFLSGSAVVVATLYRCGIRASQAASTLSGLLHQVVDQPQVAAQLVGEDVQRCLEDAGDGRHRARFLSQPTDLCGKRQ